MNNYYEIGKKATGKKIVTIFCKTCNKWFDVQKQSSHDKKPYICKNCSHGGERNGMFGRGNLISGARNGNFGGLTEVHKQNISISKIGSKPRLSDEVRAKKRIIGTENWNRWMNQNPEKYKESCRIGGINSLKLQSQYGRTSGIERKTMEWLNQNNIEYEHQFNIDNRFLYDFKVGKNIIEVNGKWFHSQPKQIIKDKIKKKLAEEKGYNILYIWEDEVNNNNFSKLESLSCA